MIQSVFLFLDTTKPITIIVIAVILYIPVSLLTYTVITGEKMKEEKGRKKRKEKKHMGRQTINSTYKRRAPYRRYTRTIFAKLQRKKHICHKGA